ncbi:MAG: hypothetical protein AB4206_11085 [Xenococcaceae cyanobacterium]
MKTNTHFVSLFYTSLATAIALVIVGAMGTTLAQNSGPNVNQLLRGFNSNDLFTPTAADRFFEEGRRKMEREAEILAHPERYSGEGILQINTVDLEVIDETGDKTPMSNFSEDSP